jgi:hypothetical protein
LSGSFEGAQKNGKFDVSGDIARKWLSDPNPNARPNADVLKPYLNAKDITGRANDHYMIDFTGLSERDAMLFVEPFKWVLDHVKPERDTKRETYLRERYWLLKRAAPDMRAAIKPLARYIATPRVAKHRFFVWLPAAVLPDTRLNAIASDSDVTFGILSSRIHEAWSLAQASMHGVGNDPTYNAKSCFETFPFPAGTEPALGRVEAPRDTASPAPLKSEAADRIAAAAQRLDELRANWLNPPEWTDWVRTPEEEAAGFPPRPVAKARPLPNPLPPAGEGAKAEPTPTYEAELKKRTLTNLYNARPAWLAHAHSELDAAVAAAYGWIDYTAAMPDEEILRRLLALNLQRAT